LYDVFLQPNAERQLKKLRKKAKLRYETTMESLNGLSNDPKKDSIPLQDPVFRGLRRVRAGDHDRIIFQICEECRADPTIKKLRRCTDCDRMPINAVKVFDIPVRRDAYKKHRRY